MTLDLARLRAECDSITTAKFSVLTSLYVYELRELLDRLEAAEAVCHWIERAHEEVEAPFKGMTPEFFKVMQAWRAEAGKS